MFCYTLLYVRVISYKINTNQKKHKLMALALEDVYTVGMINPLKNSLTQETIEGCASCPSAPMKC